MVDEHEGPRSLERTLTTVLRGPLTAGGVAWDMAQSLAGWAGDALRVVQERVAVGIDEFQERGRVSLGDLADLASVTRTNRSGYAASLPHPVPLPVASHELTARRRPGLAPVAAVADAASVPTPGAIEDYDQLSALQVVQRLEGLGPAELEEVRAYEAAGRGRRTVLAKVEQLRRSA